MAKCYREKSLCIHPQECTAKGRDAQHQSRHDSFSLPLNKWLLSFSISTLTWKLWFRYQLAIDLGIVNEAILLSTLKFTNCIFKKCLHVWTILQVFSEQEKQRPLNYSTLKRCTIHFKELPAVETASMSIQWRQGRGYDLTKENSLCWYNLLCCSAITNHGHACSSVGRSVHYNAITGKHVEVSLGGEKNPNESSPPCRRGLNYIIILHLLQSYSNEILY